MQYVIDPRSGNRLSVLGFGCMRFPLDRALTERLIVEAVAAGINYFDTAYLYGNSEATLGSILQKHSLRDQVNLATKLPHRKCRRPGDFQRLFSERLERLQTDHIDYYLIHNIADLRSWWDLVGLGIEGWIAEKQANGQIGQIGFSFHGSQGAFMTMLDAYDWDFCQIQYNYMDENYQAGRDGLVKAHQKGLPVMIMEPLLGGKLATGLPVKAQRLFQELDPERSAASWALRWLWNQPEVSVVLSGMNRAEQLSDNLAAAEDAGVGMLSEDEAAVFAPVIAVLSESYRIPCTGCNYCMPCPNGVNIPACFAAYNTSYALGFFQGFQQYMTGSGASRPDTLSVASVCIKCRACEGKCPQGIEIIKSLEAVKKRMEPWWFRLALAVMRRVMS